MMVMATVKGRAEWRREVVLTCCTRRQTIRRVEVGGMEGGGCEDVVYGLEEECRRNYASQ